MFACVPGLNRPFCIKPDLVHTFHIGVGIDLCASSLVWLCRLKKFGRHRSFDESLRAAYGLFQSFCHREMRFTSCDEWSTKKLSMTKLLGMWLKRMFFLVLFGIAILGTYESIT